MAFVTILAGLADSLAGKLTDGGTIDRRDLSLQLLTLSRYIDCAVATNQKPNGNSAMLRHFKLLYQFANLSFDIAMRPSLLVFLLSVKSATLAGWFSDADVEELLNIFKHMLNHFLLDGECWKPSPQSLISGSTAPSESESFMLMILSMYFPRLTAVSIAVSLTTKPGYEVHGCDFQVTSQLAKDTKLRLFVCQKDDVRTAACLVTPRHLSFLVNGKGVEKRFYVASNPELGPQFPSDITTMLRLGCNFLQVVGECTAHYFIAVAIMGSKPWSSALTQLEDYVNLSPAAEADEEVIVGQSRVSLRCPISHQRIRTPVKGNTCKHHQAFDYDSYVEINDRKPTWRCPCCHSYVNCSELRFDRQMKQILAEMDENVFEVMFNQDGSWAPDVAADGARAGSSGRSQPNHAPGVPDGVIILSDDDEDDDRKVGGLATSSARDVTATDFDVVDRKPDIRSMRIGERVVASESRHMPGAVDPSSGGAERSPGLQATHPISTGLLATHSISTDRAGPASVSNSRAHQVSLAPVMVAVQNPLVTVSPRSPALGFSQPSLPTNVPTSEYWLPHTQSQSRSQASRPSIIESSIGQGSAAVPTHPPLAPLLPPVEISSLPRPPLISDMADRFMIQGLPQQSYLGSPGFALGLSQQALNSSALNTTRMQQNMGHQAVRHASPTWNGQGSVRDTRNWQAGADLHQSSQGYHNGNQHSFQHLVNGHQQSASDVWQRQRVAMQMQQALQSPPMSNPRGSSGGVQVGLGSNSFGGPLVQNGGAQQGSHSRMPSLSAAHLVGMHLASVTPPTAMSSPNPRMEGGWAQQETLNWRSSATPRMRGAVSSGPTAGGAAAPRTGAAPITTHPDTGNWGRNSATSINRFPEPVSQHVSAPVTSDSGNTLDPYFAQDPLTTDSLLQDLSWATPLLDSSVLDNSGPLPDPDCWLLDDSLFMPPSSQA